MNERRFAVALFGLLVGVVVVAIAYRFVAALTVSVFLYYSTRKYHKALRRLRLPARVRALIVLASLAVPLFLLISYALVLLVVETQQFLTDSPILDVSASEFAWLGGLGSLPQLSIEGLYEAYRTGQLDVFIDFAAENAAVLTDLVSGFFLNLFIVIVVTYYLLVDGERIRAWLLRFDDGAIVREYLEAVDDELEAVLFGNLLNVIATSIIAIAVFQGYNVLAPAIAQVPYPALAGALTGIASLVPVVGMKIVYVPLGGIAAIGPLTVPDPGALAYVVGFLVLALVVVDTIPDLLLRPLLSGKTTHVGLLMLAYTLGPVVLGFYGLFMAPILLVIALTFANVALPRLLGVQEVQEGGLPRDQLRLGDF